MCRSARTELCIHVRGVNAHGNQEALPRLRAFRQRYRLLHVFVAAIDDGAVGKDGQHQGCVAGDDSGRAWRERPECCIR